MKSSLFIFVIFLLLPNMAHSQAKISRSHPFKGNIPIANKQAVKVSQYFNIATENELSVDVSQTNCKYSLHEVRTIGASGTAGLFEGPLTALTATSQNEVSFDFAVAVAPQAADNPFTKAKDTQVFQLPRNWSSLSWKISCESAANNFTATTSGTITRPAAEFVQEAEVTAQKPLIFSDDTKRIQLELTSKNVTVGTRIRIIESASNTVIAEKTEALSFAVPKKVVFEARRDLIRNDLYKIEIEPSELSEGMINLAFSETPECRVDVEKRNRCLWRADNQVAPFGLVPATLHLFNNLSITSKEAPKKLTFTSTVDYENLSIIINRREYPCPKDGRVCVIDVKYNDLQDGDNQISFNGLTSYSEFQQPATALSIKRIPDQPIESSQPPVLTVSEKLLKVSYSLRGPVKQIKGQLVYAANPASILGTSSLNNCTGDAIKTCEFTLDPNAFATKIATGDKNQKDILVTLVVTAIDGASEKELDKLSFKIINQDFVEKELNKIKETVKEESTAKQAIATLFDVSLANPAATDMVKQIYEALKDKPTSDRNRVLFGILRGIGNIAVSYFGIPIKF